MRRSDPTVFPEIGAFLGRHFAAGTGHVWTSSVSAIEIALWDILGQVAGLPIHKLLGGRVRDRVKLYTSFGSSRPAPERAVAAKEAHRCISIVLPERSKCD